MRTLFAGLFSLALAAPSPEFPHQQRQQQQQPLQVITNSLSSTTRWRSFSSHLIDTLFHFGTSGDDRPSYSSTKTVQIAPSHGYTRYGGDLVLRFNISTSKEAASLAEAADTLLLDVWEFSHDWVDIRLSKDILPSLLALLPPTLQESHRPLLREQELVQAIHDTYPTPRSPATVTPHQRHVATSLPLPSANRGFSPSLEQVNSADTNIFFADYQPLSVIEPWLRLLSSLFTTHVRYFHIGLSYEGRPIPAIRVGVHPTNNEDPNPPKRKTILITGGLHAREWIGTSTVNYVAYSLITGYGKMQSITTLLQDFDFVFIPTLNPDGYVYTWETDRLWRKNRQQTSIRFCPGIDLDHAFDFAWQAAGNPCSESYPGETAFDAVEAQQLADWAHNETERNNVEFVAFLDLHSYSQEILYPYSYSCRATPPGLENLEELAVGLSKAIRTSHGRSYEVLPACEGNVMPATTTTTATIRGESGEETRAKQYLRPRMEASGGSLLDFFYGTLHVRYSYQLKLRDRGTYGFLLPKENIIPTGKEVLNAVIYVAAFLGDLNTDGVSQVRLTKPAFPDDDHVDVDDEENEYEDEDETEKADEKAAAPTADLLDEVEEESEPGWLTIAAEVDLDGVKSDLKRRRRR